MQQNFLMSKNFQKTYISLYTFISLILVGGGNFVKLNHTFGMCVIKSMFNFFIQVIWYVIATLFFSAFG